MNKSEAATTPDPLARLTDNPRVTVRRGGSPAQGAKCVVYWMQHAQRGVDNAALDLAIEIGNELGLPIVAFFSAISNYPHANLRHYVFLQQGFADIDHDLHERGVGFVIRRPPDNVLDAFLEEVGAAVLVGDENHCREPERWRKVLARRVKIPFFTVDADVVVPSSLFPRRFFALHIFKPKLYAEMPKYLIATPKPQPQHPWKTPRGLESFRIGDDVTRGWTALDRSVGPVDSFTGGSKAGYKRLKEFVDRDLATYEARRNHPELDGTSRLSPYLHYGHISVIRIALAVDEAMAAGKISQSTRDAYINELVGWRELSVNFVRFDPNYDKLECAEPWALKTLREHASDPRPNHYTMEQMERCETYDELWNAAQLQMVKFGWMHNYMRMYWAKKILEWSPNPAVAFEWAVIMNDKYFLDGRDPNGYQGVAWAIAGKHDRPWFDRPIFGTVRYMSGASTGRKFNSKKYISNVTEGEPQPSFWE